MRNCLCITALLLALSVQALAQTTRPATRPAFLSAEEWAAINPPPISIDIKEANAAELGVALSKATGKIIAVRPQLSASGRNARYTLTASQQPFWEVFLQLDRQYHLSAIPQRDSEEPADLTVISGGVLSPIVQARPSYIAQQKNVVLVGGVLIYSPFIQNLGTASPGHLSFQWQVAVDPRIEVQDATFSLDGLVDDQGNVLAWSFGMAPNSLTSPSAVRRDWWIRQGLLIPENMGGKIPSIKGKVTLVVVEEEQTALIESPETRLNQAITALGATLRITRLDSSVGGGRGRGTLEVERVPRSDAAPDNSPETLPLRLALADAKDKQIWWGNLSRGVAGGRYPGPMTLPLKLEVAVATKTREITIPFEFTDLPLPQP
jgi:hypothetical protein